MKKNITKNKHTANKRWQKPTLFSIVQKELAKHIEAAARSGGGCSKGHGR